MQRLVAGFVLLITTSIAVAGDEKKRPMKLDDLFRFERFADPQISPDGTMIAYAVGKVDWDKNSVLYHLWLAAADGKTPPRQLTAATKSDRHPRWSPDGKWILFESSRSGTSQLWLISTQSGEAQQLTDVSTGASEGTWS